MNHPEHDTTAPPAEPTAPSATVVRKPVRRGAQRARTTAEIRVPVFTEGNPYREGFDEGLCGAPAPEAPGRDASKAEQLRYRGWCAGATVRDIDPLLAAKVPAYNPV